MSKDWCASYYQKTKKRPKKSPVKDIKILRRKKQKARIWLPII